jgi:transcriptional regulator with XRE-family HTH domain
MNRTKQHTTERQARSVLFRAVVVFAQKTLALMRRRGLSARALAKDLALSNSTVAGWLKASRPQPAQAKQIADYFEVPADVLLDDSKDLPPDPKREMHQVLEEAPPAVRRGFLDPTSAWTHYLLMESLFDQMLAERSGKKMTPEEQEDFQKSLRAFGRKRAKDRTAVLAAIKLAEDTGTFMLSHHLALQAQLKSSFP